MLPLMDHSASGIGTPEYGTRRLKVSPARTTKSLSRKSPRILGAEGGFWAMISSEFSEYGPFPARLTAHTFNKQIKNKLDEQVLGLSLEKKQLTLNSYFSPALRLPTRN